MEIFCQLDVLVSANASDTSCQGYVEHLPLDPVGGPLRQPANLSSAEYRSWLSAAPCGSYSWMRNGFSCSCRWRYAHLGSRCSWLRATPCGGSLRIELCLHTSMSQ